MCYNPNESFNGDYFLGQKVCYLGIVYKCGNLGDELCKNVAGNNLKNGE